MEKIMKPVEVTFRGGPVHNIVFQASRIPQVQIFMDERERIVHCYVRDEMEYYYDPELSKKLTANFDGVQANTSNNDIKPIRDV
jgi:hypothetical protein